MQSSVVDLGAPGMDNTYGAGRILLGAAPLDTDADGAGDVCDACPNWYNPAQTMPPWPIPADDLDCDGFAAATEAGMGTLALQHCPATGASADEDPDAWPPDFDDSQAVNITDVLALKQAFGNPPAFSPRFDFDASGTVNITDVLAMKPTFGQSCVA